MTQGQLLDVHTIPSPLCCYDPCQKKGRAVVGEGHGDAECMTYPLRCLDCNRTGWLSQNLRVGRKA